MTMTEPSPLPGGWVQEFIQKADLERSFRRLDTCEHFHGSTMRGRIRTLQLRTADAWEHFDRAEAVSRETVESIDNLRRVFMLHVYRFDNALLESPDSPDDGVAEPSLPEFPARLLEEFPELRSVLNLRKRVQGVYLLSSGRCAEAASIFEELAEERQCRSDVLSLTYLSLACCHFNLGADRRAARYLDAAELSAHASDALLSKGYFCGLLYALHDSRGDPGKAAEWKEFLYSLSCPRATKDAFLARGERFVDLARERDRLVVF